MARIAMTAADITKLVSFGECYVSEVFGFNNQNTDLYIQFHEAAVVANGAVPSDKSLLAQSKNGFKYSFVRPISLAELTIAVSTTEANLTQVGAAGGLDMTVIVDGIELATGSETVTGDLSTGVDSRTPFADVAGSIGKKLLRVDYTNNDGADRYLMITADPADVVGAVPLFQSVKVATGTTIHLNFGSAGKTIEQVDPTTLTRHYGCFIAQSTTAGTLTPTTSAASYIRSVHA